MEHTHNENVVCENKEETHSHTEEPGNKDIAAIETVHIEPPSVSIDLCEGSGHNHAILLQGDGQHNTIGTYLLEFGIAVHSVLIGLTLGTTTDSFVALFIALCFHQFFEAIALGAQIANLKSTSIRSAIFLILFFSFTTPVGIAIGIGVHAGTYNPQSVSSLLVTGILDSFAAGILIYVALVNLITADMGVNAHGFHSLRTRLKWLYFIALYLGVAIMAIIGRWA
jgi:zinc transporter 1/2/3